MSTEPRGESTAAPEPAPRSASRWKRVLVFLGVLALALWGVFVLAGESGLMWYTGLRNGELTYDTVQNLSAKEFESLSGKLIVDARRDLVLQKTSTAGDKQGKYAGLYMKSRSFRGERDVYPHIEYFRRAGITSYTGPSTCLRCHETMTVHTPDGGKKVVNTMQDVLDTSHYRFQQTAGFSTVGYDGREVGGPGTRPIPVGKVDRACGIPGSFSWTGWASLIKAKPEHLNGEVEMRSEGCGQCHIGGNYHPATEEMMPGFNAPETTRHGLDCLICHSDRYDMNQRYVIEDRIGTRWNQDRSMTAALTVGLPKAKNCLACHQHNMGGDVYEHNDAAKALGVKNPRLLHAGAKRANAFSPHDDVHSKAGLNCTDCHVPQGHKIPRGLLGTDLVSNDLPNVEVSCQKCHTTTPHTGTKTERYYNNGHASFMACETCHIRELQPFNVVLRDWVNPTWNAEEGLWTPTDVYWSGKPRRGLNYLWYNGTGTFLANGLGDNPRGGPYNPLMNQMTRFTDPGVKQEILAANQKFFAEKKLNGEDYLKAPLDTLSQLTPAMRKKRADLIEKNLRPAMRTGKSKIYPFKMFNAQMYEDMGNQGPFGAMILPFDYPTYYETGDPYKAMEKAVSHPIVKRMYQAPFKYYMMDEFMKYFGVGTWNTAYPLDPENRKNIEPHWMRQMGTLMVNHGIQKKGLTCNECHAPNGRIDFASLGYSADDVKRLRTPRTVD